MFAFLSVCYKLHLCAFSAIPLPLMPLLLTGLLYPDSHAVLFSNYLSFGGTLPPSTLINWITRPGTIWIAQECTSLGNRRGRMRT